MTTADFESRGYNYREERFTKRSYPFDKSQGEKRAAFATTPGILKDTGGAVELTDDNQLVVQLFNKDHDTGFFVDDVIAFGKRMLASLPKDAHREAAIRHLETALCMLDERAVAMHGYKDSPMELATPPPPEMMMDLSEFKNLHGLC